MTIPSSSKNHLECRFDHAGGAAVHIAAQPFPRGTTRSTGKFGVVSTGHGDIPWPARRAWNFYHARSLSQTRFVLAIQTESQRSSSAPYPRSTFHAF